MGNMMGDQFVHMVFDADPLTDAHGLTELDMEARLEIESRAIVKSFSTFNGDGPKPEKYIGYMVPKAEELERNFYDDEDKIAYTWVREYHWDIRPDDSKNFFFCFGSHAVHYLVTGGGGYTKENVARCWTMETGVLVDTKLPNEIPDIDYLKYFKPNSTLKTTSGNHMENLNGKTYLSTIK